jgi:hypothetical protein
MMFRHVLALRSNRFGIDETAYTVGDVNNRPKMIARAGLKASQAIWLPEGLS